MKKRIALMLSLILTSMKNDFLTIYGEGVVKTGSFHRLDEPAENREPAA